MKSREPSNAEDSSAAEPADTAGLPTLERYHRVLPDLAQRLRDAGMPVSPDRWQNVYDLLLARQAAGRLPASAAKLAPLLAPLLCHSGHQQTLFKREFALWLQRLAPALRQMPAAQRDPGTALPAERVSAIPAPRLRWWWAGLLLLLIALFGGIQLYNVGSQPDEPAATPPLPAPVTLPDPSANETNDQAPVADQSLIPQPIPPRELPPAQELDLQHRALLQTLGELCLLLPAFFMLAWLLLNWLTWQTVLQRRKGNPDDPLTGIGLGSDIDRLLDAPALRSALKQLHTPVARPTRRLNANATVERSARHGGLFAVVCRQRREVPELVILVEQRHVGDQMAGLAGQLVQRLRAAGLSVQRYDYRDSPQRVVGEDGRWHALTAVTSRHEGARLILIGEPTALVDPYSGQLQAWTSALQPWSRRGLLLTRRPPTAWCSALNSAGYSVADIGSAGLRMLALEFVDDRNRTHNRASNHQAALADTTVTLPPLLQDLRRWSQPLAPDEGQQRQLLDSLQQFLGDDGLRLLATLAAYPQLHWGLTRVLDISLFPPRQTGADQRADVDTALAIDPATTAEARERRLLKIARLPWSRNGWLPDWLREALLERAEQQTAGAGEHIRALYRQLLRQATTSDHQRVELPISVPSSRGLGQGMWLWLRHRSWRVNRWFGGLKALSAEHGTLNDSIFADVLFGWRLRLLDFILPKRLLRRRLGGALGQALAPRLLLAIVIALAGAWLADRAWQGGLREQALPWVYQYQTARHGEYQVTLWHREQTRELAGALQRVLERGGFTVHISDTPLTLPPLPEEGGTAPAVVNKVQWGDRDDLPMASHIEQRLTHLTWGQAPEVTNKLSHLATLPGLAAPPAGRHLRVLLLTPGATGSAFSDPLVAPLTDEQRAEFEAKARPAPEAVQQPALQPSPQVEPVPPAIQGGDLATLLATLTSSRDPQQVSKLSEQIELSSAAWTAEQANDAVAGVSERLTEVSDIALQAALAVALSRLSGHLSAAASDDAIKTYAETLTDNDIPEQQQKLRLLLGALRSSRALRDPLKVGGDGPPMIPIPGGSFMMGSPDDEPEPSSAEGPQHRVTIQPFAISRTEVSFADYDRFAEATGRQKPGDSGWGRADRPVINVSWEDATAYAAWLSEQTGQRYRLPSAAEWEYAARGGTTSPFWTGDCIDTARANYDGNFDYNDCGANTGLYRRQTVPAASLPPNAFGLHEVAGNVYEWVADCWHTDYANAPTDGSAWLDAGGGDCARRVLRGGGWADEPRFLRSAFRYWIRAGGANGNVGIRLARTL